jgi:hypothetical protein
MYVKILIPTLKAFPTTPIPIYWPTGVGKNELKNNLK